jgi:hypothetical protein
VLADLAVVGCIMKAAAAPVGAPWLWTLAFGHHEDHTPTHGGCDVIVRQELAAGMRNAAGRAPLTGTEARTLARVRGGLFLKASWRNVEAAQGLLLRGWFGALLLARRRRP